MAKYKFTNKAVFDLTQIWNYTVNKWSEDQEVEITRILHEQMDIENRIKEK